MQSVSDETGRALSALLDDDTADALKAFGLDAQSPQSVFHVSIDQVTAFFSNSLASSLRGIGARFTPFFAVLLLIALLRVLTQGTSAVNGMRLLCICAVVLLCVAQMEPLISALLSAMRVGAQFMHGYVPIYTGILALSGAPTGAMVYSGVVFALSQGVTAFCDGGCVSAIGCFFSLLIANAFSLRVNLSRFIAAVNRALSILMGLLASVFASVLGVRSALSASLDAVSVKSTRFLISSLIPVVGGSISDAYSAILGSLQFIKGSVAVVGILVLLILLVPPILETLLVYFLFLLSASGADILDCADLGALIRGFSVGIRFLLLAAVLELFAVLIATGVMLSLKGGG